MQPGAANGLRQLCAKPRQLAVSSPEPLVSPRHGFAHKEAPQAHAQEEAQEAPQEDALAAAQHGPLSRDRAGSGAARATEQGPRWQRSSTGY